MTFTRNILRIATSVSLSLVATSLVATTATAAEPSKPLSAQASLSTGALIQTARPIAESPVDSIAAKDGTIRVASANGGLALALPGKVSPKGKKDNRHYFSSAATQFAVAPTQTGAQVTFSVANAKAPTSYPFSLAAPAGFQPRLTADGGIDIISTSGALAAHIETPWARDAAGKAVATQFKITKGKVTQVVNHRQSGITYPVVADPSVKLCDWRTAACIKFSKKETKKVNDAMFVSLGAGVGTLCGLIPNSPVYLLAAKAICAAVVAGAFYSMRGTFNKAKRQGKCVEVKFGVVPSGLRGWKVVSC